MSNELVGYKSSCYSSAGRIGSRRRQGDGRATGTIRDDFGILTKAPFGFNDAAGMTTSSWPEHW